MTKHNVTAAETNLGPSRPQYANPPAWLLEAVARPSTSHFVTTPDVRLHYRSWNADETSKPALLLAHGYKASSHWWDFIAPHFTGQYRVFAMDFSGIGDSGWREQYSAATFTEDVIAILEHGIGVATVIGHSYGGLRTLQACTLRPDLIEAAIILDSRVRLPEDRHRPDEFPYPPKNTKPSPFPDYPTIRGRYRVIPEQPLPIPDILEHIAFHSIERCAGGWRWRRDPALPHMLEEPDWESLLPAIQVPVNYVYGEKSTVVEPWRAEGVVARLPHCEEAICIPHSYHHLILDQPLVLVEVLDSLLHRARRPGHLAELPRTAAGTARLPCAD